MTAPAPAKTSAKVPIASAASARRSEAGTVQASSSATSFCTRASISSRIRRTASRSWPAGSSSVPVLVLLARVDRAGIAAAHRDHDVGGAHDLVGQRLRELLAHVDAELGHRLDHGGVDLAARRAPGRADVDAPLGAKLDEPGGHLAAAGVVDADEQHLGLLLHDQVVGLGERLRGARGRSGARAPARRR